MRSVLAAVFLLSSSSMSFEVLLTRYFSFTQWSHLSFMVISIALFGMAAAGTVLSLRGSGSAASGPAATASAGSDPARLGPAHPDPARRTAGLCVVLFALFTPGSFLLVNALPFDYVRLPVQPSQVPMLLLVFLVFCLPFFATGLAQTRA